MDNQPIIFAALSSVSIDQNLKEVKVEEIIKISENIDNELSFTYRENNDSSLKDDLISHLLRVDDKKLEDDEGESSNIIEEEQDYNERNNIFSNNGLKMDYSVIENHQDEYEYNDDDSNYNFETPKKKKNEFFKKDDEIKIFDNDLDLFFENSKHNYFPSTNSIKKPKKSHQI